LAKRERANRKASSKSIDRNFLLLPAGKSKIEDNVKILQGIARFFLIAKPPKKSEFQ